MYTIENEGLSILLLDTLFVFSYDPQYVSFISQALEIRRLETFDEGIKKQYTAMQERYSRY